MIGASEVVLEKLLGGITKLGGGTLTNTALKNLDKVDNVLARFAKSAGGKLLMNAGSEALEEGLQSIIEPYLWQAVSGEEASVNWEEALYSALLGFVNGGLFEGADMAIDITAKADTGGKAIISTDSGMDARMNLENKVAGVTSADVQNTLTSQIGKVSQQPTAGSVKQLSETVQAANNQANASVNQEDVTKSLRSKGISSKKAAGIAEAIVARLNGQELTRPQRNLLSSALNSSAVRDVISELIQKKTVGIDSAQSNVYDREAINSGLENGEEAAQWDIPNQRADTFSNHDYATVTEGSTLHQPRNSSSEGNYGGGGDARKFNNWDDMKGAYKGTIPQFIKENKPKYSPEIRKWFDNGGSIEIQDIDGKQIWTYTSSAGISVSYIDGYIKFPDEYLYPTIKSVDVGEFTGDRGKDIDKMLPILQADYGIDKIPDGYTVHHDIVNGILQLVDENIHTEFTHIGGYSIYK